ncbi:glycoside hydrolase family 66 protein [Cohnella rhizosphaerae]|uniref:Glycoside hydrolase family 66 protein n=1 Tax=Cohnella rhizosphaerae TaxID=1457232 RepID=A0A9X4KRK3_9BACL|nr:glycoside hydrolase family 66 protein [Cohnella rhizosphaerae]MDG0809824.1 glycoside hydrolase family 66 protein [Cohnella rhizosphaerae]
MIRDIYPLQAQFRSGAPVRIAVDLSIASPGVRLDIAVSRLDRIVLELSRDLALNRNGETSNTVTAGANIEEVVDPESGIRTLTLELGAFEATFDGFGVDADLLDANGALLDTASTAFDVVDDWRRSTRYGFLSDFDDADRGDAEDVKWLNKLHINLVQFYDWMYKHDDLVSETNAYTDLMGRTLCLDVVREKTALCHRYGMKAYAYGAVYAASKPFAAEHPDWALYQSDGEPYDFIGLFTIMNIEASSPWHDHIIEQYRRAVAEVGFDGIHMDTYGFPKTGISSYGGESRIVRLEEHFPQLIDDTKAALSKVHADVGLIFNNVGNWPVGPVAAADQEAVYVEVWKPYERYHHIRQIIREAQSAGGGKPVILAAYLAPFRTEANPARAHWGGLLLTSIIAAHGAYHLLAGESQALLTQAYYADYSPAGPRFATALRQYYDFQIRYANLLYDASLRDVSMTHADGDNMEYVFDGPNYSTYGEADKVWTIIRENEHCKTISFINLTGQSEDYWNEGKEQPSTLSNIVVRILLDREPSGVFSASPDERSGRPQTLEYRLTSSLRGLTLEVDLPELNVWSVLCITC